MLVKLSRAFTTHRLRPILSACFVLALLFVFGSVELIGPAFVSAQTSTTARKIRLFEGFTIKILSGKIVIYGESTSEASPPALPSLAFLQCAENATPDISTWTFTAQNVGTSSATRATIIGVFIVDKNTVHDVTSVSVGGDSATEVVDEEGSGLPNSAIYILSNPSGTSENVVVTNSEAASAATICLWAANNLSSLTAVASTTDDDPSGGSSQVFLNLSTTSADGIAVGICGATSAGESAVWTGLIENGTEIGSDGVASPASIVPTNGSALSVNCDWSGTKAATGVSAAFR